MCKAIIKTDKNQKITKKFLTYFLYWTKLCFFSFVSSKIRFSLTKVLGFVISGGKTRLGLIELKIQVFFNQSFKSLSWFFIEHFNGLHILNRCEQMTDKKNKNQGQEYQHWSCITSPSFTWFIINTCVWYTTGSLSFYYHSNYPLQKKICCYIINIIIIIISTIISHHA